MSLIITIITIFFHYYIITIFFHNHVHKDGENRTHVFRVTKKSRNQSLSQARLSGKCCDCARGCRLFTNCICPTPLYNNARDGITTDCSRYPLVIIRMQTDVTAAFVSYDKQY